MRVRAGEETNSINEATQALCEGQGEGAVGRRTGLSEWGRITPLIGGSCASCTPTVPDTTRKVTSERN